MYSDQIVTKIKMLAEQNHGGPTTISKVINEVKKLAQSYDVGDLISVSNSKDNVQLHLNSKIHGRLKSNHKTRPDFFDELYDIAYSCGYNVSADDDILRLFKV